MNRIKQLLSVTPILLGTSLLLLACQRDPSEERFGSFTDNRDGQEYEWVRIGSQVWMAENLAWLPAVSPPAESSDSLPVYYVFRYQGNSASEALNWEYYDDYGVFYNWPAAVDLQPGQDSLPGMVQGACPDGWHLPSDAEWDTLVNYLGGEYTAGKSMKSTRGWNSFEGEPGRGTNSSGFNGLPAGSRHNGGGFNNLGYNALFWSSTRYDEHTAWYRYLGYFHNGVYRYFSNMQFGFSVRCVRNVP